MNPAAIIADQVPPAAPKPPQPDKPGYNGVEFKMPDDFAPPADVKPGEEFQALATLKVKSDGVLCLTAIDGSAIEDKAEEKREPPKEVSAEDAMKKGMANIGMPS